MPMYMTSHQRQGYCAMCSDDATAYNHCSFCGESFDYLNDLSDHLDECKEFEKVFGSNRK